MVSMSSSQTISFCTTDGLKLEADIYPARNPWCVLAHGKAYDKNAWKPLAMDMQQWGWTALTPNFMGYGQSEQGDITRYDQDILASISYACTQHANPIILMGASMGGVAVLAALAKIEVPIEAVILLSPAGGTEYLPLLKNKAKHGLLLFSGNEVYAGPAREIAAHPPFPLFSRDWPGTLHAHELLYDPITGPEARTVIKDFMTNL